MQRALDTHDTVLRALLARYYGYEVTTEGDSFTMAFHDPVDAVRFFYQDLVVASVVLINCADTLLSIAFIKKRGPCGAQGRSQGNTQDGHCSVANSNPHGQYDMLLHTYLIMMLMCHSFAA